MQDSVRRHESQVELSDAGVRYCRKWLPAEPRRAMILVHGYAEHTGRYDDMAMDFAARGYAVHAYDQAGHGRTAGPRGHVDRFDRLLDELARFVELVALDHPGLPLALVGHSMGGLVTAATAAFRRPEVDRIVLSGALLELGGRGASARQTASLMVARLLSVVMPRFGFSTGLDLDGLSRDPEVIRRYEADPYVKDHMTARFAAGLNATVQAIQGAAPGIERPVLLLHGGADPICPPTGSQALHANLSPSVADRSAVTVYPELRHEIFQEPERAEVWSDMRGWLESENTAAGDA